MAEQVAVTRVTVDYAIGGTSFTVTFDNVKEIGAIVFNRADLAGLKKDGAKEVQLNPLNLKPAKDDASPTNVSIEEGGSNAAVAEAENGLWWHMNSCTWFHPEALG